MTARIAPCPVAARHWFTYYGRVGSSSPVCRRCGAPNPNYGEDRDDVLHEERMTR